MNLSKIVFSTLAVLSLVSCADDHLYHEEQAFIRSSEISILDANPSNEALFSQFVNACQGVSEEFGVFNPLLEPLETKYGALKFNSREDFFIYVDNYQALDSLWDQSDTTFFSEEWYAPLKAIEMAYGVHLLGNYYAKVDWEQADGLRAEIDPFRLSSSESFCAFSKHRDVVLGDSIAYYRTEDYLVYYPDYNDPTIVDGVRNDDDVVVGSRIIDVTWKQFNATLRLPCVIETYPKYSSWLGDVKFEFYRPALRGSNSSNGYTRVSGQWLVDWGINEGFEDFGSHGLFPPRFSHVYPSPTLGECDKYVVTLRGVVEDNSNGGVGCDEGHVVDNIYEVEICNRECKDDTERAFRHYYYEVGSKKYEVLVEVEKLKKAFLRNSQFKAKVEHKKWENGKWRKNKATEMKLLMGGEFWIASSCNGSSRNLSLDSGIKHDKWKIKLKKKEFSGVYEPDLYTYESSLSPFGEVELTTNNVFRSFSPVSIYD